MEKDRTNENSLAELSAHFEQKIIDENTALVTYIGYAGSGVATSAPYWMIKKIEFASATSPTGVCTIKFAGSYRNKNQIWDNRTGLSYTT